MGEWPVKDAKSRFSELIERADAHGPQVITRHGKAKAVVLSLADYRRLEAAQPDFKAYLLSGPKPDDVAVERPRDRGREVEP